MSANPHLAVQARALARFGTTIRELRIAHGITGAELGNRIHMSQPQISRIERGRHILKHDDITRISDALELSTSERKELFDQYSTFELAGGNHHKLESVGFEPVMREYYELGRRAIVNRVFTVETIPGLMQTECYMRGMFRHFSLLRDREDFEAAVSLRLKRQRILWQSGRSFEFLLFETALYARYCPLEDHLAQLDRVRTLSRRPNVRIGVVPARITPPGALSTFSIFDNWGVIMETLTEDAWIDNPADVSSYLKQFNSLWRPAIVESAEVATEILSAMDFAEANGP